MTNSNFDSYARSYEANLMKGLAVSGEGPEYFARGRVAFLSDCLRQRKFTCELVLDFGCGIGNTSSILSRLLQTQQVHGIDISSESIAIARKRQQPGVSFWATNEYHSNEKVDLVYCNGIFHHIPLANRQKALQEIRKSLRPGGYFALWENNPWNPGTKYVMSRIPFDKDAITLSAPETCTMVEAANFKVISTNFLFIFPRALRWFRGMEPMLSRLPIGAQYQVLCQK